ncbi:D-alanyl-D-alanine carboxypeptidase [Microbispora sp. RL4-1S]|uniref:D-alanyl-D-alanine carboxypeptidase n=1 Tax=Microbispora oryzae TaxID=2806554 RepID=A0A940WI04_9ACTN|nr:serine hydrolase [Microbispora oryzae]MBP2703098.1 D-alanyl-D-alanine carboxypeptidase [Microbispora oryzae]
MRTRLIGALAAALLLTGPLPIALPAGAYAAVIPPGVIPPGVIPPGVIPPGAAPIDDAPSVTAAEAYLVDATARTVLLAKRQTRRVPVASLTKVMTAYVVRRRAKLDDVITITKADVRYAAANGASHAGLRPGERLTVRDLLYALMLPSGADAAHALAQRYGPGIPKFVAGMNDAARRLKMTSTRYANPDGLPSSAYSTAADQVALAQVVMRDPVIAAVAKTRKRSVTKSRNHRAHVWRNSNTLLDDGAIGLKTGYTIKAGYCLAFVADQDGHRLFGVILGERSDAARHTTARSLLSWAAGDSGDDLAGELVSSVAG